MCCGRHSATPTYVYVTNQRTDVDDREAVRLRRCPAAHTDRFNRLIRRSEAAEAPKDTRRRQRPFVVDETSPGLAPLALGAGLAGGQGKTVGIKEDESHTRTPEVGGSRQVRCVEVAQSRSPAWYLDPWLRFIPVGPGNTRFGWWSAVATPTVAASPALLQLPAASRPMAPSVHRLRAPLRGTRKPQPSGRAMARSRRRALHPRAT